MRRRTDIVDAIVEKRREIDRWEKKSGAKKKTGDVSHSDALKSELRILMAELSERDEAFGGVEVEDF